MPEVPEEKLVPQTDPTAKAIRTLEGKQSVAVISTALVLAFGSDLFALLSQADPASKWIAGGVGIFALLSGVWAKLGFARDRTALKIEQVRTEAVKEMAAINANPQMPPSTSVA